MTNYQAKQLFLLAESGLFLTTRKNKTHEDLIKMGYVASEKTNQGFLYSLTQKGIEKVSLT